MKAVIVTDAAGTVAEVVSALERELSERAVRVFAKIDHAAGAHDAGLALADEVVLIFGNPLVGTALMRANPIAGLDLPLRMLVWDDDGRTRIAYRDPHHLAEFPGIPDQSEVLDKLTALLRSLAAHVAAGEDRTPAAP